MLYGNDSIINFLQCVFVAINSICHFDKILQDFKNISVHDAAGGMQVCIVKTSIMYF